MKFPRYFKDKRKNGIHITEFKDAHNAFVTSVFESGRRYGPDRLFDISKFFDANGRPNHPNEKEITALEAAEILKGGQ